MMRLDEALDAIIKGVIGAISEGEEVKLRGLGTFKAKKKKETQCSHPRNPGEIIVVPGKAVLKFVPSNELKEAAEIAGETMKD